MMKVVPTVEGGLRIEVGTATDWLVLEQIAPDALKMDKESLPSRLSALMDEASASYVEQSDAPYEVVGARCGDASVDPRIGSENANEDDDMDSF